VSKRAAILQADINRVLRAVTNHAPGARVVIDLMNARVEITTGTAPADSDSADHNPLDWLLNDPPAKTG
jgi:hypothetical protein